MRTSTDAGTYEVPPTRADSRADCEPSDCWWAWVPERQVCRFAVLELFMFVLATIPHGLAIDEAFQMDMKYVAQRQNV